MTPAQIRKIEAREWWLWAFAILVTLLLTGGVLSFLVPLWHGSAVALYPFDLEETARGLACAVLLFDCWVVYQQVEMRRIRRRFIEQGKLFRLINDNAADMIALVDMDGRRLYNSPSYERVLGYTPQELQATSALAQVHPQDRARVAEAAAEARRTGVGSTIEYRMQHRDGKWLTLESTSSVITDTHGAPSRLVIVNRDITARKEAEEKLLHHAFYDPLTELPNRALLLDRLKHAHDRAIRRPELRFAVLFIDLDRFGIVNESHGHRFGDRLIVEVSRRLALSLRREDTISRLTPGEADDDTLARIGGDEFAVLLTEINEPADAIRVATRLQKALATAFVIDSQEVYVSTSIGIGVSTMPRKSAEDLLRNAQTAAARAKTGGFGGCEVFDTQMHARAVQRLKLETDLHRALERGELRVYYQPIVFLQDGRVAGVEALMRWQHPERGLVSPQTFIPVAEETGLVVPMSKWLLEESCRQIRAWQSGRRTASPLTVAVNISGRQLAQPDLVDSLCSILQQSGIDPGCLELEITETAAMADAERSRRVFTQLKELGVRLSIDDFGTGYSSLTRLQSFSVDTLKVDRSFIARMDTDAASREIVHIILMLAKQFGLSTTAEGIERPSQIRYLKEFGCDFAQGFLFCEPTSPEEVEKLLSAGQPLWT